MADITASMVKELRERTGAGMMECKKALVEVNGDMAQAEDELAKRGLRKAQKSASRTAKDGVIKVLVSDDQKSAIMVEVNCETDFVSKQEDFVQFVDQVAKLVLATGETNVEALSAKPLTNSSDETLEDTRTKLVAKIGENIQVRRAATLLNVSGTIGAYEHGVRIGCLVEIEGGDATVSKEMAMHVAAMKPDFVSVDQVPSERYEREKEIFMAQSEASGKPKEIIEKMVTGKLAKFFSELCVVDQPFFKEPDLKVNKVLSQANAKFTSFVRFEVGEGIVKEEVSFAEEVAAQVKGAK